MANETSPSNEERRTDYAHPLPEAKAGWKRDTLTPPISATTQSFAEALVLKEGDIVFAMDKDGRVPLTRNHAFGLYHRDCRYLDGYDIRFAGHAAEVLFAEARPGSMAALELSNPVLPDVDGQMLPRDQLGLHWERRVSEGERTLHDRLIFHSFANRRVHLPVTLEFRAEFDDIYVVRGLLSPRKDKEIRTWWDGGVLHFACKGLDGLHRQAAIAFDPVPESMDGSSATLTVALDPQQRRTVRVAVVIAEGTGDQPPSPRIPTDAQDRQARDDFSRQRQEWTRECVRLEADDDLLPRIVGVNLDDLRMLRSRINGHEYIAAGVPWFVTLYGRDSLVAALEVLAFHSATAEHTLRALAEYQGRKRDEWSEEQPGRIHHLLRRGELSNAGRLPFTPYYGTVDATPLFLILLARHAAWTGSLALFEELRSHVDRALEWMDRYGDSDGDGYIDYSQQVEGHLINQGWKDSGSAIVDANGELAEPPVALAEVQGYAYLAKQLLADLFERSGALQRARALRDQAAQLRERFNRDFWNEHIGTFVLARHGRGRLASVVASNAGQVLWSGIAESDKALRTARRLMEEDMFSGWGIRTLSSREKRYNPAAYHVGSVWPHDNALIAAGLRRYSADDEAVRIFDAMFAAASHLRQHRLPEMFCGFARSEYDQPVDHPVACHPQAWGAGAMPYLVQTVLGLEPDGFEKRLRIVRPILPGAAHDLRVLGLHVGAAQIDLRFRRRDSGVDVEVLRTDGDLDVVVER